MSRAFAKYLGPFQKIGIILGVYTLIYLSFIYLFPLLSPFITAAIIALINEPLTSLLQKRFRMSRKVASGLSLLFTISIIGLAAVFIIIKLYHELIILQGNVSNYIDSISFEINDYFNQIQTYYSNLPYGIPAAISTNLQKLIPQIQTIVESAASYLIITITSIPKMSVFIIITLISTYFISSD
ncbi:MAG: sporulation integral rane protein YtvI, partial [Clostridiales bacterium]|nr:sporulation integral rane protein YtvI [Clostridiales bacterium]